MTILEFIRYLEQFDNAEDIKGKLRKFKNNNFLKIKILGKCG